MPDCHSSRIFFRSPLKPESSRILVKRGSTLSQIILSSRNSKHFRSGGVVQTVAFRSYVSKEKSELRDKMSAEIVKEFAAKENFKIMERADVIKLPEKERDEYVTKWFAIRAKAKPMIAEQLKDKAPDVNVKDFVDHIDYLVKTIGIKHVGISSDFDGGGVEGWDDAS